MIIAISFPFMSLLGCRAREGFQREGHCPHSMLLCAEPGQLCPTAAAAPAQGNVLAVAWQRWPRARFLRDCCRGGGGAPEVRWACWDQGPTGSCRADLELPGTTMFLGP